ncbi:hypothetical protein ABT144_11030 [Streptomyces sp. NPDC002039]|uniref:hypothetical protein n=1 Tax=Streptomyces sp. NPDC002039 TaxID=3154660 RepID=UPI00332235C8
MSDLYSNPDPDFAVATLGRALRELLATLNSAAPEHDAYGGEHASWRLMLRPAADDQDDVPAPVPSPVAAPAVAPAVAVSVDAGSTRIEVADPVVEEAYRFDGSAAGIIAEGGLYAVPLPDGIVRICRPGSPPRGPFRTKDRTHLSSNPVSNRHRI